MFQDYSPRLADFGSTQLDNTDMYGMTAGYVDPELLEDCESQLHHLHFRIKILYLMHHYVSMRKREA